MKAKVKIVNILLILLLCLSLKPKIISKELNAETSAKSIVVIEATSKRILYSKSHDLLLANASTTKIATFLTVLKYCQNLDTVVNVDDRAIGIPGTSIYLKKGEKLSVKELLYGMMLVSGNDASVALALHISDNIEEFANLMTQTAKESGAKNTTFKNPHGLDEKGHLTTAYDLACIASECYKYPVFEEIVTTKTTKISGSGQGSFRYLKNKNRLLHTLEGCNGVKTGYTDDAGRCLVSSAKRNKMHVICVVLNCGPMFEESASLIEDAFSQYEYVNLLPSYNFIKKITVLNGEKDSVKCYSQKNFSYPLTEAEKINISYVIDIVSVLTAPVDKEIAIGIIEIYLDNQLLFSEKIYTMEEVKSIRVEHNLKRIISNW